MYKKKRIYITFPKIHTQFLNLSAISTYECAFQIAILDTLFYTPTLSNNYTNQILQQKKSHPKKEFSPNENVFIFASATNVSKSITTFRVLNYFPRKHPLFRPKHLLTSFFCCPRQWIFFFFFVLRFTHSIYRGRTKNRRC